MAIENQHPGYDVVTGLDGWHYPVRLEGGASSGNTDYKGRKLDNSQPRHFGYEKRQVYVFLGDNGRDDIISFDNENHAHNFLNKWVREEVGLGHALDVWSGYLAAQIPPKPSELVVLQQRLAAMRAAYDIAEVIIRGVVEGTLRREEARKMFTTMTHFSTDADVVELFNDLLGEIA
jgi:hypothetical protein